jgi:hypothetical protein
MQAWPLIASGTAWSKGSGKRSTWHQQSTSKEPAAETAHALGPPQIGQSGAMSGESGIDHGPVCVVGHACGQAPLLSGQS